MTTTNSTATATPTSSPPIEEIIILYGGELSSDIGHALKDKLSSMIHTDQVPSIQLISMSEPRKFKPIFEREPLSSSTVALPLLIFIVQTIENDLPTEEAGTCIRYLKRKTHPNNFLTNKLQYTILGLGDTNLLLDRQHTTSKDCNAVAQQLDLRLGPAGGGLGAIQFYKRGEADERIGLTTEVEPWMDGLVSTIQENLTTTTK